MTLFEKEGACGGHSLTDESPGFAVDLGFQVVKFFHVNPLGSVAALLLTAPERC